ncbi:MAG: AEC family transporter [Lachnospiraceae bacterium]|nr:AEC family transporter [Lachnospiraceae bacterium]
MSAGVVVKQMLMIAMLIALGFYSYKKELINDEITRGISALIVTFTNPCLMIYSMLSSTVRVSGKQLFTGLVSAILTYLLLIIVSEIIPGILKVEMTERYCYWFLGVFGNIGFIGIPLTEAVLGKDALVYVCFHNLIFCLIIYTIGINKIRKAAGYNGKDDFKSGDMSMTLKKRLIKLINTGTVSAIFALIMYVLNFKLPDVIMSTCDYAGRATTFLSMIILGAAVARMNIKSALSDKRLAVFSVFRLVALPIMILFVFKIFIKDPMIVNTTALMLAVPAGNMPLIMATQHKLEASVLSNGIVLTTVLSLVTIPIVTLFC